MTRGGGAGYTIMLTCDINDLLRRRLSVLGNVKRERSE
jgi:hypothetical protein